jgi:hypothetical protein
VAWLVHGGPCDGVDIGHGGDLPACGAWLTPATGAHCGARVRGSSGQQTHMCPY